MERKNPFNILGLHPDLIQELSDEQIEKILDSQYRALQRLFHPDMNKGYENRSKELNEARELLDRRKNPELFILFREQFTRKRGVKKQVSNLEAEIKRHSREYEKLYSNMVNYLTCLNRSKEFNVFNLRNTRITLSDTASIVNESKNLSRDESKKLIYNIEVDNKGLLMMIKRGKITQYPFKAIIGGIDSDLVRQEYGNLHGLIKATQPNLWLPSQEDMRLIEIPKRMRNSKEIIKYENHIHPRNFMQVIRNLSHVIDKHSYIFSLNTEEEPYFSLEGQVINIERKHLIPSAT